MLGDRSVFVSLLGHQYERLYFRLYNVSQTITFPFQLPEYLQICGGPTNFSARVRKALGCQTLNPFSSELHQMMDEIKEMTKYLFQTENPLTLVIQASGNGGNESIITNLLDPGDKAVVAVGGYFGDLVVDMCERHDIEVISLQKVPGEIYTVEELEETLIKHKPAMLFVTHGEPTGGTVQKLEGLGEICHKYDCLLAVDAVVSIGVLPLYVDRWGIDAVTAGSQKAIGAPPGLCLMSFSPRAQKRMFEKKKRPPFYLDIGKAADYWNCFGNPRKYHLTFATNTLAALREGLAEICEEGLDNMWIRHQKNGHLFWKRLTEIGLTFFVEKEENRFCGVTCVNIPEDIHWPTFLDYMKKNYSIEISCGYGPTLNKALRMGIMGINSRPEVVEYVIKAMKESLQYFRNQKC